MHLTDDSCQECSSGYIGIGSSNKFSECKKAVTNCMEHDTSYDPPICIKCI